METYGYTARFFCRRVSSLGALLLFAVRLADHAIEMAQRRRLQFIKVDFDFCGVWKKEMPMSLCLFLSLFIFLSLCIFLSVSSLSRSILTTVVCGKQQIQRVSLSF